MSVNRLKKIIIKKNVKTEDKYIETCEPTNKNVISETYNYTINKQNKKKGENGEKNNKYLTENRNGVKNDLNELIKELYLLKNEYELEKAKTMESLKVLNDKLSETDKQLKFSSKQNYQLILKLKDMESYLKKDYLKSFNERMKKRNLFLQNEQMLKKRNLVKDEEIKIAQKLIRVEKNEHKRYENLLNEVNNGMEENINGDLEALNEEINKLNNEIEELYKIKFLHKYCQRNIQNLKNTLNLYNTEYEFESKKKDMLTNQPYQSRNKMNLITNFTQDEESEQRNLQINYSQNIRKIILEQKIPRPEKLNISTSRYITEKINLINRTQSNEFLHEGSTNNNNNKNINLFKENEYNFLKKIIPSQYMDKYVNEFDNIKKEREEIQKSLDKNNSKKDNYGDIQFKLDYIELKKKEESKRYIQLLLKYRNNEKKKKEMQSKIKIYEQELKKYNKKIDVMEKMQKMFFRYKEEK